MLPVVQQAPTGAVEFAAFSLLPAVALGLAIGYSLLAVRQLGDLRPLVLVLLLGLMVTHQLVEVVRFQAGLLDQHLAGELPETGANLLASLASYFLLGFIREERAVNDRLTETSEKLRASNHVNELLRNTNRELVRANSRDEIEAAVCEEFVDSGYGCATIVDDNLVNETVSPRTAAGLSAAEREALDVEARVGEGVVGTAFEERSARVVPDRSEADDPFLDALPGGGGAAAVVPLVYGEVQYGVLVLVAADDEAFDAVSTATLEELGRTVAYAINAVESKQTLLTDNVVEMEFDHADSTSLSVDLTDRFDCSLTLEWLAVGPDDDLEFYATVVGADPEDVLSYATGRDGVEQAHLLNEHDDQHLYRFRLSAASIVTTLAEYGAVVSGLEATDGTATVTASVSNTANAHSVVEAVGNTYEGTELVSSRERERRLRTKAELQSTIDEQLTDRQKEALYTAYAGGYFEWPRENSSEEVADVIGVAQSTFLQHLRAAQRKLFETLFEDPDTYTDLRNAGLK